MAEKSFPLENTMYTAADAQLWFATRTSGVYANDHLGVTASGAMNVTMKAGIAWLHYDQFGGCVYANTDNLTLPIEMSDASYDRIDRLCIRLEMLNNRCYAYIKKGTPAASPKVTALQRDNVAYEISIAQIRVRVGTTSINAGNITDDRLNAKVCGLMRDGVTGIDTSVISAQATALLEEIEATMQAVYDNVNMVNLTEYTATLSASGWTTSSPYKQVVSVPGILASDKPFVDINTTSVTSAEDLEAVNGAWGYVVKASTATDKVTITVLEIPDVDIPIKIKVVR